MAITTKEEDRVCINCDYQGGDRENPSEPCRTCCNGWNGEKYTENHFKPDPDFILHDYAEYSNCKHQDETRQAVKWNE